MIDFKKIMEEIESVQPEAEVILSDNKEDWHKQRLGKLTASAFDDMMQKGRGKEERFGTRAMKYIYEKVAEMLTCTPHTFTSQATNWGNDMESEAIARYEEQEGVTVTPAGFVPLGEYAGGTPDGLVGDDGIIEVKCPFNPANHVETVILNRVPEQYMYQVQGNLLVTGRKWCDFISYDPRVTEKSLQIHIIRVERDEEIITSIQDRIAEVSKIVLELYNNLKNKS